MIEISEDAIPLQALQPMLNTLIWKDVVFELACNKRNFVIENVPVSESYH